MSDERGWRGEWLEVSGEWVVFLHADSCLCILFHFSDLLQYVVDVSQVFEVDV